MIDSGDTAWLLASCALVLIMTPGLAFFYGGLVRSNQVLNTIKMSFVSLGLCAVVWALLGYSLAFSEGNAFIGNLAHAGLKGVGAAGRAEGDSIPHLVFAAFQMMFAVITPALISGAVVGRMRFKAYMLFIILWSLIVYAPLAHWVWGPGGWIGEGGLHALDFAGGTVVHVSAGVAALALVTTMLAAAAAVSAWTVLETIRKGKPTLTGAAIAAVVGLVAITPGAGFVSPHSAMAIGAIAAVASSIAIEKLRPSRFDDTLDVFACHGVGGIIGCILTGVFATTDVNPAGADGLLAGNPTLLWAQCLSVLAAAVFVAAATAGILALVRLVTPLRVPDDAETSGIDLAEHAEHAYSKTWFIDPAANPS